MRPAVSILLPVRNAAPTLPRCLGSLAAQTLREHEVVAVDDGSEDPSGRILEEWAARDPRVRVVRTPHRGLVAALQRAAAEAAAPVLARMDADDACAPHRLEAQWKELHEGPRADILGSRVRLRSAVGRPAAGMQAYVDWQNALVDHDAIVRDLWIESPLVHPTVMMPAEVLRALGGYRDFDGPEDYDLWLRAERAGRRLRKHPDVLLDWWDSEHRLTRASARYSADAFLRLKVDALQARHLGEHTRPVVIWGAGPIGKSWARALVARGRTVAGFVEVDRRKLGQRIHGARVCGVDEVASLPPALHLAAVARAAGRDAIRAAAAAQGLADGRDLLAVA
jgi:glycosyltransferase involved in cell wall biosynthesis